jgi:ribonuclease HI
MIINVYTDGGCSGNPGPGAWAYVAIIDNELKKQSGFQAETTNNRMELTAVIRALKDITGFPAWGDAAIRVATDSQYVQKGMTAWIHGWIANGWRTKSKQPVKNRELWIELHEVASAHKVEWTWVRGHAGNKYNEMCDAMVQSEMRSRSNPS